MSAPSPYAFYCPYFVHVTSVGNTSSLAVRVQVMPMYGPQKWFDCDLTTVSVPTSTTVCKE